MAYFDILPKKKKFEMVLLADTFMIISINPFWRPEVGTIQAFSTGKENREGKRLLTLTSIYLLDFRLCLESCSDNDASSGIPHK